MLVSVAALSCYLLGALGQIIRIRGGNTSKANVLGVTTLGAVFQSSMLYMTMYNPHGINLSVFTIASLTTLTVTIIAMLSSIKKPSEGLLVLILPITILSVLITQFSPVDHIIWRPPSEVAAHILVSALAYGILMVAALQSLLLSYQEYQLRHHRQKRLLKALPSLQTMERLMFEFLVVGVILLTFSLLSGFLFLENMFAQHLLHKTALSVVAWGVFSVLLVGHWTRGWRGMIAMRWIVTGFLLLALSYFGWRLAINLLIIKT
ncbi:MAG: cytochrome c biogenesis protein CcsA [Candidatus Endonucleobacter bathymodioli]|uniref:Cytochrome c biogenesis protein CcsA n=1 Tax=Candidatus Endonucleibacter bathymodioli TaxID=539814 RepID=A0AA90NQW2_9GAMM|nr:cytochrome c biogenesis protein CcsA [Candidatus Endonucleobacter bathymodioli]